MAIVLISQPSATPGAVSDYQAQNTLIGLLAQRGNVVQFSQDEVKAGTFFNIGGAIFSSTSDTAISGTPTNYVKLTVSGSNATASYVALPQDLTFNETYNGYYSGSNLILFDEEAAAFRGEISAVRFSESRYTTAARILERLLTVDSNTSGLNAQYLGGLVKDNFIKVNADGSCLDISSSDLNDLVTTGTYMGAVMINAPGPDWYFIEHFRHDANYSRQIAYPFQTGVISWDNIFMRAKFSGTWTNWVKLWNSANGGADSGLDADLLDGKQSALTVTADTIPIRDASGRLQTAYPGSGTTDVVNRAYVADMAYKITGFLHITNPTHDAVFTALAAYIPNTNDYMKISGGRAEFAIYSHAVRTASNTISLRGVNSAGLVADTMTQGSSGVFIGAISICW